MSTTQKYVGRGNSAQNSAQTVKTPCFAPLTTDERSFLTEKLEFVQTELLSLVDEFARIGDGVDPVTLVAELLEDALTRPVEELASEYTRDKLTAGLQLITFLSQARQWLSQRQKTLYTLEFGKEVDGE